ncbi:hypothetical protein PMAYCL1PPCAC_19305, partial [Pristionchus mayeri]
TQDELICLLRVNLEKMIHEVEEGGEMRITQHAVAPLTCIGRVHLNLVSCSFIFIIEPKAAKGTNVPSRGSHLPDTE